ncbi:DUF2806 domain-containing protein [Pseudomonas tohonis]|uniref:DUF2806 domain-containing protein n=1 Tax=Pseudomonas tohonis TaxID=2725477 RepID=UPI001F2CB7E0|nr:DUF2806 domain-containing protein [Pseudomonas tohonis]
MSDEDFNDGDGVIGQAIDAITGLNVPEPIKKNLFKVVGRLCTAAVEVPVAYLEGIAEERRAETRGRIKIIERSASEIAEQMMFDPEYAKSAVKKFGERIVRERVNLDIIATKAAEIVSESVSNNSEGQEISKESISDDWLNEFEREACQKSTEEMQEMFARLLAGEVGSPNTFSVKSIRMLGSMDKSVAALFKKFCSMCISLELQNHVVDVRVPSLGGNASSNSLQKFGLSFDSLNYLQEYGLIISDYNSWSNYEVAIVNEQNIVPLPLTFGGDKWGVQKKDGFTGSEFKIHGVALSRSGRELFRVVECEANLEFASELISWLDSKGLQMIPVS